MPREIKFRGKSQYNGKWAYGSLVDENKIVQEVDVLYDDGFTGDWELVDPETVGQYIGLKDSDGIEIYEGDILSTDLSRPYLIVEFRNGAFVYQCHDNGQDYYDFMKPLDTESNQDEYLLVIGNIYEHPELPES